MSNLLVGIGQEVITPALGTGMAGYSPRRPALSIHDDLHVTAFAFQTGDTQALLISADLVNIYYPQDKIRDAIAEASGVPQEHMVISCIHTHSGPPAHKDPEGVAFTENILIPKIKKAAVDAVAAMKPAQMGIGTAYSEVAVNRRRIREDGASVLGQNPHGCWDPTMTVVAFRDLDGQPIGNIIHYGCHNTASGQNSEITRDWCGVAIDRLQEVSGGVTAFINGCGGDCGPRLPNGKTVGNLQMALELGGRAAGDAVSAWRSIRHWQDAPLKVLHENVSLPLMDIGTEEQILKEIEAMGDYETLGPTKKGIYERLQGRVEYLRQGNIPPKTKEIPITALALGSLGICPLPFEIFSMVTLRIKDLSPFTDTLVVGYSNDTLSYFPSVDQLIRGGYEVQMFRSVLTVPFTDDAEQHLVTGCTQILRNLYEK